MKDINKGNKPFWSLVAEKWKSYGPPYVMSNGEVEIYKKFLKKNMNKIGKNALVLGSTPQLRDLFLEYGFNVTLIDINKDMIKGMGILMKYKHKKETKIVGNWFDMGKKIKFDKKFDVIAGDHILTSISFSRYDELLKIIKNNLEDKGIFLLNVCINRKRDITFDKFIAQHRKNPLFFKDLRNRHLYDYLLIGNCPEYGYNPAKVETNYGAVNKVLKTQCKEGVITKKEYVELKVDCSDELYVSFPTKKQIEEKLLNYFLIIDVDYDKSHEVFKHHVIYELRK